MKSLKRIFTIPFKYAPLEALWIMIQKILAGIIPTIEVVITALFIDSAISIFNGTSEIKSIVSPILLIMILTAYGWLSEQLSRIAQVKLETKLRERFRCEMVEKTASLNYIYIEDQDTLDLISRVIGEIETKCNDAYASMLDMFAMVVKILGLLCLLFTKVWWCSLVIVAISVPLFLLALKGGQVTYEAGRKVQKYYRRVGYLEDVLNGRDSVDERSVFNYSKSVNKMWVDLYELSRKIVFKANLEWYLKSKIGSVITAALSMIIVVILIFPLKAGLLTIGMFMSIANSVFSLINLLSWSLPGYGDALSKNAEYMIDLDNFMNLEKEEGVLEEPSEEKVVLKSLEFKNVSFKYPGDSNYVLKNLSFKIEKGKHYALVGTNGAGKTTIIKLIIGLYKDYEGEILINGISLKEYTQNEIKSLTSIVYQDFAKYNLSFKDNIALGDVRNIDNIEQVKAAFNNFDSCKPQKDYWYVDKRYFRYPHYEYKVYGIYKNGSCDSLVVFRVNESDEGYVLRVVDYIGSPENICDLNGHIDVLMEQFDCECCDMYWFGADGAKAGFVLRDKDDTNIIPNYLNTLLQQNIDYYFFTTDTDSFVMFKADGDQDRKNLG